MNSRQLAVRKRMLEVGLLTQRQLADACDLSYSTLTTWLAGKELSDGSIEKIGRALKLSGSEVKELVSPGSRLAAG